MAFKRASICAVITVLLLGLLIPVSALAETMFTLDDDSNQDIDAGYLPSDEPLLSLGGDSKANESPLLCSPATSLPSKYDPRDVDGVSYVTSVKNQGRFNTCWSFSVMGAIEASMLSGGRGMGEVVSTPDLSERHLAFFTYHTQPDPLWGTSGDATLPEGGTSYLTRGGNDLIATYALASWMGPVWEDAIGSYEELLLSYDSNNPVATDIDPSLSHGIDAFHLRESLRIPMRDSEDIKRAIMSYGGVSVGCRMSTAFLRNDTGAYYCNESMSANHAVVIVGWDDSYRVDAFREGLRPTSPGAWLAKNSWGTGNGASEDGYLWISYEDCVLPGQNATAYVVESADQLDNVYQYDGSSSMFYNYLCSGGSLASVFTARGNVGGTEGLEAVGISLTSANVHYSLQVYTDLVWQDDPTSGTSQLASPQEGVLGYAGYHTIDLEEPVSLQQGQTFSVVITLSCPGGEGADAGELVRYDVDRTSHQSLYYSFDNAVESGQTYECDFEGAKWDDLADAELSAPEEDYDSNDEVTCSARLKAFTRNHDGTGVPAPELSPTNPPRVRTPDTDITWKRLWGETRYETMAVIAQEGFSHSEWAVVATGDNYPDALVASALAGMHSCPILLTASNSLSPSASDELERLGTSSVIVMGGPKAISDHVIDQIHAIGVATVVRVCGPDRISTSLASMDMIGRDGDGYDTVVITTGENYADALSIGPFCYSTSSPILLVGRERRLNAEQITAIHSNSDIKTIVVVGGDAAVDYEEIRRQLGDDSYTYVLLSGNDRYATSYEVACWEYQNGLVGTNVTVVTGRNFPDALAGAAFAGNRMSVLLLIGQGQTGMYAIDKYLFGDTSMSQLVECGYVLGGDTSVSQSVKDYLESNARHG